jgi:hypothetical protein
LKRSGVEALQAEVARLTPLATEAESLKEDVKRLTVENERMLKSFIEEASKSGALLSANFKLAKLEKQNLVIGHIAAGRSAEAITEILNPQVMLFNVDVRYDDQAGKAHADELLANVKAQLTKALAAVEYTKQEAE